MITRTLGPREREVSIEVDGRSIPESVTKSPEKPITGEDLKGEKRKEAAIERREQAAPGQPGSGGPSDKGGQAGPVTQVLKHISGYQPANWLAPVSATNLSSIKRQLSQASNGDPRRALTWQASLLLKILRVLFRV